MKNRLLVLGILASGLSYAQTRTVKPVTHSPHFSTHPAHHSSQEKTLLCQDTLRYPQIKEQILGASNFNVFDAWKADNEAISMGFGNSASLSISKIEFYGGNSPDGTTSVTVQAAIYNVNASYVPTTLVGSGTITITDTNYAYRYVTLSAPVTVTGNYAVVLTPTNTNGVVRYFVNDATAGQSYDETLAYYKSGYYTSSNGSYVTIPTLTSIFTGGPYNFEPLVAPIVSYTINTQFTNSPASACLGTPVTMTNGTAMSVFQNRFTSYQAFSVYFGQQVSDSSFVYFYGDNSAPGWSTNSSHTYTAAGTYTDTLISLGGFWNSCVDYTTQSVTINPIADATFSYPSSTICSGSSNPVPTVVTSGGTFSSTSGLNFASSSTGEIDMTTSSNGTYAITYTTTGTCPMTYTQNLTITSAPDASFTYSSAGYCQNVTDPSPSFTTGSAGTFSSTTGLSINAGGTIDVSASTPGTYVVTNSIAASGACPQTDETQTVTILAIPTVSISGNTTVCQGSSTTITASGADSYVWSPATDLSSVNTASTDASPSVTTTYTTAGLLSNGCSASGTVTITVNNPVTPSFPATASYCVGETATLNGTSSNGITGTWSPATVSTTAAGTTTYTFTPASGQCATGATTDITVNANPTVTFDNVNDLCVYNAAVTLSGTPAGGTFSGTGVTGSSFNPATAGTGTFTLTYSYADANGCSASQMQDVLVDACLGLDENGVTTVSVYPNPAATTVNVTYTAAESQLSVLSTDGKVLYSQHFSGDVDTAIDLSSFASAMYHVVMTSETGTTTVKVIKK